MSKLDDPYLDILKKWLTRYSFSGTSTYTPINRPSRENHRIAWMVYPAVIAILERKGLKICRSTKFDPSAQSEGKGWPAEAETMIGLKRLDNLHACIDAVIQDQIPGDFIETGVWRGGACIFMRAALNVYGDQVRKIWVADSFEGLPKPDGRYQQD
jgi:O-methyltransferase